MGTRSGSLRPSSIRSVFEEPVTAQPTGFLLAQGAHYGARQGLTSRIARDRSIKEVFGLPLTRRFRELLSQ